MSIITVGSDEYKRLLRRYCELHDRYMSDNLSRPETIEFVKIMQKLSIAELAHGEDAIASLRAACDSDDYDAVLRQVGAIE